jgi:hypothetical protein
MCEIDLCCPVNLMQDKMMSEDDKIDDELDHISILLMGEYRNKKKKISVNVAEVQFWT